ncbi:MAG: glutamate--tRNA ligase [bacterium]|nr:glutamate--tRNA ligase [bacterium]
MLKVRTRFAPSPTGYLHIGSLRMILFNYLVARTLGGRMILRIEDTDQKREVTGAVDSLLDILDWLGLPFDEGPHVGGDYGPYIQSQRKKIYASYGQALLKKGGAYRCFCAEERLKEMREKQQAEKLPPRYDRACRDLSREEAEKRLAKGEKFVIRQKMPLDGQTTARDELRGEITFNNADLDDQVLIKSDGMPTYQFASVVDDHLMAMSHVLRGEEWLPSFPKNILLYLAFGWEPPKFIHLPLTLNKSGGKLSKRQGDVAVEDYRAKGYLPEALLNFSVLQGWHPSASSKAPAEKKDEILSLEEMLEYFDYQDMGTSPAIFDEEKLDYFNGWYIRRMSPDKLAELCLPYLERAELIKTLGDKKFAISRNGEIIDFDYIKAVVALEQERLKKLSEIGELTGFFFTDQPAYEPELLIWKKMEASAVKENLQSIYEMLEKISSGEWQKEIMEKRVIGYLKENNLKLGDYLWPTRAALTGRRASPGPFEVAEILGKEGSLGRISQAIKKL